MALTIYKNRGNDTMGQIKLDEYFAKQQMLDTNILQTKRLVLNDSITTKKLIAFKQEFGELLQRLPEVFKFWSNKKNALDYDTVEEWVDGFHFLLSIGLDLGYNKHVTVIETGKYDECTLQQLSVYMYNGYISTLEDYQDLFEMYLTFIYKLGFGNEAIRQAYDNKNAENFKRQATGY